MFGNIWEVPHGVCESSTGWVESGQNSNVPRLDADLTLTAWEFVTAGRSVLRFAVKGYESQKGQQCGYGRPSRGGRLEGYLARLWPVLTLRTPALSSVAGGNPS